MTNEHALYRGALQLGAGTLTVDANLAFVRDTPPSPVLRAGTGLTALTPINANFNPADAAINENKYQLAVGYSLPMGWGTWDTLASFAYSDVTDRRAFLHPDLSGTADTQNQRRYIDDGYLDSHLTVPLFTDTKLIVGADLLYGLGRQTTLNGNSAYTVPLDGSVLPPPIIIHPCQRNRHAQRQAAFRRTICRKSIGSLTTLGLWSPECGSMRPTNTRIRATWI